MLALVVADERPADRAVLIDQEPRGPGDVQRVEADAVPDAVGADDVAPRVDQDVERESRLFDVAAYRFGVLRQDACDLDTAGRERCEVVCELTEPVAAVRSPRASMERQQQPPAREKIRQRAHASLLIGEHESRRARQR